MQIGALFNVIGTKDEVTESDEFVRPEIKGKIMITHTDDYASSGYILNAYKELYIGDLAIAAKKGKVN